MDCRLWFGRIFCFIAVVTERNYDRNTNPRSESDTLSRPNRFAYYYQHAIGGTWKQYQRSRQLHGNRKWKRWGQQRVEGGGAFFALRRVDDENLC